MTQTFTVKQYGDELNCYTSALSQVHGKPQKLSVCGEYLYWTQGKQQELFRTLKSDVTSQTAERVIKSENEAPASTPGAKLSKEEEMLRERTRSVVTGISSYQVRAADEAVFYLSGLDLYVYYQNGPRAGKAPLKVFDFMGPVDKARLANAPNLCIAHVTPKEGEESRTNAFTLTFVNQHNLYIADVSETPGSAEAPLTLAIEQITTIGDALHQCGAADYMIQEEFDRYTGHYANDRYVIFSYTDESAMRSVTLLKSRGDVLNEEDDGEGGVEKLPYSRVGDVNASTTLVVFDRQRKSYHLIPREAIQREAPWVEYIPRFGFKDHDSVYLSALSRTQEDYIVLSCPIADLPRIKETDIAKLYRDDGDGLLSDEDVELMTTQNELMANESEEEKDVKMTVEWHQSIPWAWVEIPVGPPIFFGKEYDVLLCHAAETATAHFHLFYRRRETEAAAETEAGGSSTPKGKTPTTADAEASPTPARPRSNSTTTSVAALSRWEPLTSGPWNVKPGSVKVMADQIAFLANAHGRLSQMLYTIPFPPVAAEALDESAITRLTLPQEHVYVFCFDTGAHSDRYYYTASQRRQLTQMYAGSVKEKLSDDIRTPSWLNPSSIFSCEFTTTTTQDPTATDKKFFTGPTVAQSHGFYLMGLSLVTPYVVTTNNRRGVPISAQVYVAPRYLGGERVKAPLAVFVYGGPHAQLIYENDFDGCAKPNVQVLLRHGISVAIVDGQMSNANGLRDLSICKRNMGHFETADYVDMIRYLAAPSGAPHELPPCFGVDTSRVAIFGWSYGGYATLLAMCQAPDVFKVGFAGAPVGDWKLYDTGYTERYMGVLYEDPGRPRRGSSIWRRFSQVGAGAASQSNAGREEEESVSASAAEDQTSAGSASPHSPAGASTSHVSTVVNAHGRVSKAYLNSTIEHYVSGFPEERNRVYIAHGLLDENVHFAHTSHVVSAMIKANKPVNVLVYPGERHGLRQNAQSRFHHDGVMVKTFVESLHKDEEKEKRHALYIILLGVVCVAYFFRWKYVLMIAIGALVFRH